MYNHVFQTNKTETDKKNKISIRFLQLNMKFAATMYKVEKLPNYKK